MARQLHRLAALLALAATAPAAAQDGRVTARAWRGLDSSGQPSFPELELPEVLAKSDSGVAFSGGGIRAYTLTLGFLRGLLDAELLQVLARKLQPNTPTAACLVLSPAALLLSFLFVSFFLNVFFLNLFFLLQHVRYVSGVSGGAWATAVFTYYDPVRHTAIQTGVALRVPSRYLASGALDHPARAASAWGA